MIEVKGNTLVGYAAVWDSPSKVITEKGKTFVEHVRRGAFTAALANPPLGDVVALWQHGSGRPPLGRTSAGTLKLVEDERGLWFEIQAPESAADVVESVRRGDLKGVSFGADVAAGGDRWSVQNGVYQRDLLALKLYEISIVISAAYPGTSVVVRHHLHVEPPDAVAADPPAVEPPPEPAKLLGTKRNRRALDLVR